MVIRSGDEEYAALMAAYRASGGVVVEHGGFYYHGFWDNGEWVFARVEPGPEKDARGRPSSIFRGWYPPLVEEKK